MDEMIWKTDSLVCRFHYVDHFSLRFLLSLFLFPLLQKIWLHQFVYLWGFLFLSGACFAIGCTEIAIICTYWTLSNEDYRWWWPSFIVPAASGIFMFFGTVIYQAMLTRELFDGIQFVTMWMMTSYVHFLLSKLSKLSFPIYALRSEKTRRLSRDATK